MNRIETLTPTTKWTPDCQGKWDYDGRVVVVSTRYWPRCGGFHILNTAEMEKGLHPSTDSTIKPSADAAIHLEYGDGADDNGLNAAYITLIQKEFEGETEAEVKAQVEVWVKEQFDAIAKLLLEHYKSAVEEII
jgi:hypothetical protein